MWNIYKFLLKWTFILMAVLIVGGAIYLGVYSIVDPEGYQAYMAEVEMNRKAEEERLAAEKERQEAERLAEEERKANMWCRDSAYDNFAKNLNNRLPDSPLTKQNVHDGGDRITINFDGYEVFYCVFITDSGGPNDGEKWKWLTLDGTYSSSSRKLSDKDKEIIKIVFGLGDAGLAEMVKAFQNGDDNITINGRKYNFFRNTGSFSNWGIEYKGVY